MSRVSGCASAGVGLDAGPWARQLNKSKARQTSVQVAERGYVRAFIAILPFVDADCRFQFAPGIIIARIVAELNPECAGAGRLELACCAT